MYLNITHLMPEFDTNSFKFVEKKLVQMKKSENVQQRQRTATAGSDVVQSGRPIFDDFFQHLWPYIGNNTANVVFQMVKRLWLIRIDQ
ncbi:hypothetical protein TNCV_4841991 [Trichonephila clavipes]|uniref:Uncharacterized protein n=1 Tax=Trichonephila clavipes TaxID=2585209 RepID=A0A8X7BLS6_TRICX|nr:hypothetical protein TNCV_4841991 [Trichonephila clavipes]